MERFKIENPVNSDVCGVFLCSPLAERETNQGPHSRTNGTAHAGL
jgi:hypothetical protein